MDHENKTVLRRRYTFSGVVQGVGFRWRSRHAAEAAGVSGWVRNEGEGVVMELQGSEAQLARVLEGIERSSYIRIEGMEVRTLPPDPDERGFHVRDDRW